jgi:predicted membrane-bound spermidine synthase
MDSNDPQREELKKEVEKLKREFASGKFRGFCVILFVISIALVTYLLISGEQPEAFFPIHLSGNGVLWASFISAVFWAAIGFASWLLARRMQK